MAWAVRLKVNPEQVVIAHAEEVGIPARRTASSPSPRTSRTDDEFQDYVIVHELLHLRSAPRQTFKAVMTALVPDWRELRTQQSVGERMELQPS